VIETGLPVLLAPVTNKVYPRVPQGVALPYIRYQRISTQRGVNIDASRGGVNQYDIQIDCMAASYAEAKQLAKQVESVMHLYRGAFGSYDCQLAVLESESDFEEIDGEHVTHWVAQRYSLNANEE
jgi:hypothetical protein